MGVGAGSNATAGNEAESSAPLGAVTAGRLDFVRGASNLAIRVDPAIAELFRARFHPPPPRIEVRGGEVVVEYPRFPTFRAWRERPAEMTLNGSVRWRIRVRGGAARLRAELRGGQLAGVEISGGASQVEVLLPAPNGTVPVRIGGGAAHVTIRRPAGVPVSVRVGRAASDLDLDGQHFAAVAGDTGWDSPGYRGAADRYQVEIEGGASDLSVAVC